MLASSILEKTPAVIIGGGVAGLASALRLGQSGRIAPLVLESEDKPGGLARSLHFKGVSTDLGPHRLHTELPEVKELIASIAGPSLYTVKRRSRIYLRGKFLDYPPSPLQALAHLGPLRVAGFGISRLLQSLRPAAPEQTYESLMRRAFGPALYEFLLRPYTQKVWKTDPAEIHPDTARVRVSAGSLGKMIMGLFRREKQGSETALREFLYVRGGVETLVRHLVEHAKAAGAELRLSKPVTSIRLVQGTKPGRWRAGAIDCAGEELEIPEGGTVISTVPLTVLLGDLLPPVPELEPARRAASGLTYLNFIFVCVIVNRKIISGDNWLYFPEPEWIFNRAYEAKNFDPEMGPEDRSVLCVEITCRPGDALEREADEAITARVIEQLERTGLFRADEVDETLVYRLRYGYPLYSLDYAERLDTIFKGLASIDNLLSSGRQGLFNHNNTDHSIFMGLRAADAILEGGLVPADRWYAAVDRFKHFRIVD